MSHSLNLKVNTKNLKKIAKLQPTIIKPFNDAIEGLHDIKVDFNAKKHLNKFTRAFAKGKGVRLHPNMFHSIHSKTGSIHSDYDHEGGKINTKKITKTINKGLKQVGKHLKKTYHKVANDPNVKALAKELKDEFRAEAINNVMGSTHEAFDNPKLTQLMGHATNTALGGKINTKSIKKAFTKAGDKIKKVASSKITKDIVKAVAGPVVNGLTTAGMTYATGNPMVGMVAGQSANNVTDKMLSGWGIHQPPKRRGRPKQALVSYGGSLDTVKQQDALGGVHLPSSFSISPIKMRERMAYVRSHKGGSFAPLGSGLY